MKFRFKLWFALVLVVMLLVAIVREPVAYPTPNPELNLELPAYPPPTKLTIASSKRFLVRADGSPMVWIGDTFWRFSQLTYAQRLQLLDDRASKGYTVVMIRISRGSETEPAGYRDNLEPIESYFREVDSFVAAANQRGMYVAIAAGWWDIIENFDRQALYNYGRFLGDRYKDNDNIIWLGAGESGSYYRRQKLDFNKVKSLVEGIRDGDTGNKLLTIHADYQRGTSLTAMGELVDFHNWQTSQWCCPDDLPRKDPRRWTVWQAIAYDYQRFPTKPTLDLEAWYENNSLREGEPATPYNVRRRAYFTILAGGFGHSYGAAGVWDATANFSQALQLPGATQIGYLSQLLHSLGNDLLELRPAQSMVVRGQSAAYDRHIQAASANDGSYALIYTAGTRNFSLDLASLSSKKISVFWFDPRTKALSHDTAVTRGSQVDFTTPEVGDWLLILGR